MRNRREHGRLRHARVTAWVFRWAARHHVFAPAAHRSPAHSVRRKRTSAARSAAGSAVPNSCPGTAPQFVNAEGYSAWKGAAVPEDKRNYDERKHEINLCTIPVEKAPRAADAGAAR